MGYYDIDKISTTRVHAPISPSNVIEVPECKYLYCLTAGDAVLEDANGTVVTYPMLAGDILWFWPRFVKTATTATLIAHR